MLGGLPLYGQAQNTLMSEFVVDGRVVMVSETLQQGEATLNGLPDGVEQEQGSQMSSMVKFLVDFAKVPAVLDVKVLAEVSLAVFSSH